MRNWLGQDINHGDIVYRGAREGDSSSYRLGRVLTINGATNKAKVVWMAERGGYGVKDIEKPTPPGWGSDREKTTTVAFDTLVLIDVDLNPVLLAVEQAVEDRRQRYIDAGLDPSGHIV